MKESILKLREEGKSYNEICKLLGCNKSTVSYHCGYNQKEKQLQRQRIRRKEDIIGTKIERFKSRDISEKCRSFQRRNGSKIESRKDYNFTTLDFLKKIGKNPICSLSGQKIDLSDGKSYHIDHIIPASKGGMNTLDNAGLLNSTINKMKHDLTPEEFLTICKKILEYQGFEIRRKDE